MAEWLLTIANKVSSDQWNEIKAEENRGGDPARFLVANKLITIKDLLAHLSSFYDRPSIYLNKYHPDEDAIRIVPEDIARKMSILPLFIMDRRLFIATSDPDDLTTEDYIRQFSGFNIELVAAAKFDIEEAINKNYLKSTRTEQMQRIIGEEKASADKTKDKIKPPEETKIQIEDEDAPVIKIVNHMLMSAVRLGASDIHIEPFANRASLRYRIDGVLYDYPPPPLNLFKSVVSRIKITSDMDIAEKRLPQDGRSSIEVDGKVYDLRISIIPNLFGESIVIRILDTTGMGRGLDEMGFEDVLLKKWRRMVEKPYGIILVTGPTGAGKSTTLYATLKEIVSPDVKVITLEDPVEYQLDGVTQFQMNSEIGFTFSRGLRSLLRHDPDIVMLGEIRDLETAEIAIRASLTGHLLLSTLHTNDSPSAVTRLVDMGVQPFLITAALIGVMAQRLVRRLFPQCKKPVLPSTEQILSLGLKDFSNDSKFYEPVGCPSCNNLGYKGRIGIYELLEINQLLRKLSRDELTIENIKSIARDSGFITLFENGVGKALQGITSIEEAMSLAIE